jgi:transcriptional regulator with GAF, ATPase, and Fis domain
MAAGTTEETLGPLLNVLAQSLDVQEVFARISALARHTVPHDCLVFGLVTEDGERYRVVAVSEDATRAALLGKSFAPPSPGLAQEDFAIFHHLRMLPGKTAGLDGMVRTASSGVDQPFQWHPGPPWVPMGYPSWLRLTVRLRGDVLGFLNFLSRAADAYTEADVPLGRRIADLVALAFAHERLAEEERRRAAAQERAVRLEGRVASLTAELEAEGHHAPVGTSKPWRDVLAQSTKVAGAETTVLLTGESGTGKEVVAHLIHRGSRRAEGPFVALNCAALPEALLESELFGYEKGAFTGAVAAHAGRLEQAGGGTLFLDEVAEMSPAVQAKFLRVLEQREFQRLGGTRMLKADVRVIAATNRDLKGAVTQGAFREDLYYRLHVFAIHLPPLRERPADILPLLEHFVETLGPVVLGRPAAGISREAREHLLAHPWPGNVRELRNAVERALILCEGGLINPEHLPWHAEAASSTAPPLPRSPLPPPPSPSPVVQFAGVGFPADGVDLEAMERTLIEGALKQAGQNRSKAAKLLGLSRSKLYTRMERFGLA